MAYSKLQTTADKGRGHGAVFPSVSAQQANCRGAADNQSARAAVSTLVYDCSEFGCESCQFVLHLFVSEEDAVGVSKEHAQNNPQMQENVCDRGSNNEHGYGAMAFIRQAFPAKK
ncbi:hypothetical protein Y032_0640g998 [Ancylostoma ceylanicum]|uniref:Uncharacterized protein n=1 Tax=Ancylostoma ceylanicum TaxID=53326 RepID=A0A016WJI3_9BILA|nr:hypothetical protein Y032_0640g998 [Ancylostoma ceylanicum]